MFHNSKNDTRARLACSVFSLNLRRSFRHSSNRKPLLDPPIIEAMVAQQKNYNFSMTIPNPYWFRNLTYFSQIPTLLGLMGLQNSLGPLSSSRLQSDFLPWECRYPMDCSRIVFLSSGPWENFLHWEHRYPLDWYPLLLDLPLLYSSNYQFSGCC